MVKTTSLVQLASVTLITGTVGVYGLHKYYQRKVRQLPHYLESFRIVAQHEKAKECLGPPIEVGSVDFTDRKHNYLDKRTSMVRGTRADHTKDFSAAMIKLHLDEDVVTIYDNGGWAAADMADQKDASDRRAAAESAAKPKSS